MEYKKATRKDINKQLFVYEPVDDLYIPIEDAALNAEELIEKGIPVFLKEISVADVKPQHMYSVGDKYLVLVLNDSSVLDIIYNCGLKQWTKYSIKKSEEEWRSFFGSSEIRLIEAPVALLK